MIVKKLNSGTETDDKTLINRINELRKAKNAVILAHYYQDAEIQEIADFVGDSLALAQQAKSTDADIIVFAGVHFMAETAKIINPQKKVLVPDLEASCSLAESCPAEPFAEFLKQYPEHKVVTYINCSAEVKALSDIVCTSSNAREVVSSIPEDQPIVFAPDHHLGEYLVKETGREMVLWDGACLVHEAFALDKILKLYKAYPKAKFLAHPESSGEILELASYIGSTAGIINFAIKDDAQEYIIATEAGILHEMQKQVPNKLLIPAPSVEDNTCACSECHYMKMNSLEKIYNCLVNEEPELHMNEELRKAAYRPIAKMLALS
jgi:quinolinate synthase